jgi:hypothetical protein
LIGRLKAKAFVKITGSTDTVPTDREIWTFLMRKWKENDIDAEFMFHLLYCGTVNEIEVPASFSERALRRLLSRSWSHGRIRKHVVEGRVEGYEGTPRLACILLGHFTPEDQLGYYAAVYDENAFPEHYAGFVSLVISDNPKTARIETLGLDGWQVCEPPFDQKPEVRVALATLADVIDAARPLSVHVDQINMTPAAKAPEDPEFDRLVQLVYLDELSVSIGVTDVARIRPYDLDFCSTISAEVINHFVDTIRDDKCPTLVVYWAGDKFVTSDDYCAYLAYRRLDYKETRIAVMGAYPPETARAVTTGQSDLMPPLVLTPVRQTPDYSADFKEWLLDEKLRTAERGPLPVDDLSCWAAFARHLANRRISEADLHRFLLRYPMILNVYGSEIKSEVCLGGRYRVDLTVLQTGALPSVQLIELEHAKDSLFTKGGRMRNKVVHAKQQVEDWLRWWREHPEQRPDDLKGAIEPKGLVIMGRSRDLTDEQRRILAHLNEGSDVTIITYDELLDQFGTFLLRRLDNSRNESGTTSDVPSL